MAIIGSIDGPNRLIYLSIDTVNSQVHPIDIYKEMRELRRTTESLRKYDVFLIAKGNEAKGGGKFTERYVVEQNGTRIIPYDVDSFLTVIGTIITDDGQEGIDCFDRSGLVNQVDLNYIPPQVEVIEVQTGSAVTEQDKLDIADRVWDETQAEHVNAGSTGESLSNAGGGSSPETIAAAVWANTTRTLTSFGTLIADIWNYVTRVLTSSSPPTKEEIRTEIDTNSTEIAAIKERTDNLPNAPADVSDIPTAVENATELLDNQSAP